MSFDAFASALRQSVGRHFWHMEVSINGGAPKSYILMGFSLMNHPFWGTTIYGKPHMLKCAFSHGPRSGRDDGCSVRIEDSPNRTFRLFRPR